MKRNEETSSLSKAISGGIAVQMFQRALTFILNQALLRYTTPASFGIVSVQLEILLNVTLFLARDASRQVILRQKNDISLLYFASWPLGLLSTVALFTLYGLTARENVWLQSGMYSAVFIYALSVLVELGAEPGRIHAIKTYSTRLRTRNEAVAALLRTLVTFVLITRSTCPVLVAYALGQLTWAVVLNLGFLHESIGVYKSLTTAAPDLGLLMTLTRQSVVKQVLTEGDKIILGRLAPLDDQGGFAVADAYGSLVARILFQPLEENCRIYFAKKREKSLNLLKLILNLDCVFGIFLLSFGPAYIDMLFTFLAPAYVKTTAPGVLKTYCLYLPVLGLNGVLEGYMQSTAQINQLSSATRAMVVFTIVFVSSAVLLVGYLDLGAIGLVGANIINMLCRIAYAVRFIKKDHGFGLKSIRPHLLTLVAASTIAYYLHQSAQIWTMTQDHLAHLSKGIACFLALSTSIYLMDLPHLRIIYLSL